MAFEKWLRDLDTLREAIESMPDAPGGVDGMDGSDWERGLMLEVRAGKRPI